MESWEGFSAFGDYAELQHVCGILDEYREEGADQPGMLDGFAGENSTLIDRLNRQCSTTKKVCDEQRIGLFERTWIAEVFNDLFRLLDVVVGNPAQLSQLHGAIELSMHKVLIAAHDVFDPAHRAKLIAEAEALGIKKGLDESKSARTAQSIAAVAARDDQKDRAAFLEWGKAAVAAGVSASNVDELQALAGFSVAWSRRNPQTLKKWAREAGFSFKSGRPKNKK